MTDKLILKPKEYELTPSNNFVEEFSTKVKNEEIIEEKTKLYLNEEYYNVDINNSGCFVRFNPNKINNIAYGARLEYPQLIKTIKEIEEQLYENGFKTNLHNAAINSYDFNYDIYTDNKYAAYENLLNEIAPSRIRNNKKKLIENSLYYDNSRQLIKIYDKAKEHNDKLLQLEKKGKTGTLKQYIQDNIMRIEHTQKKPTIHNGKILFKDISEKRYFEFLHKSKKQCSSLFDNKELLILNINEQANIIHTAAKMLNTELLRGSSNITALMKKVLLYSLQQVGHQLPKVSIRHKNYDKIYRLKKDMSNIIIINEIAGIDFEELFYELKNKLEQAA